MKMKASIEGMSCMHCVNHVKEALSELKGISNITVSLEGKFAEFDSTGEVSEDDIKSSIEDFGYEFKGITII
ncbi:cation transporter [Clostridium sporogenes]|uniref:Copper chaperone CopZ n=2 Tax=Clostridium TaxID=1485 RepID=A0A7X5PA21_CLOSG|nr:MULTISPECIES: cation transporter [Clostridium]AJD29452.1 heavy-metal-associated domain protein [Clostridium botulinum Prevot_594]AVP59557.1 heavy metal transport/detoxification protein [Clostridium botulinum]AKC62043.1 copper chaperone CopZ [Clostridium sporogenes]AKJ89334.1 heavy metal transport/detoxification protein [Clostridium sporogenes]AVP65947.1 heavy metal transport/detoxification protein [Clostridium botulinum]